MRYNGLRAIALVVLLVTPGAVQADVTASHSNDPTAILDQNLTQLLGADKHALRAVSGRRLEQLLVPVAKTTARAQSGTVPQVQFDAAWLAAQPRASGDAQWQCLSEALYFEARGESVKGQFAVAEVILNRAASSAYPDTICGVVHQGTGRKYQCQFTYTCDGHKEVIAEPVAYARVGKIARLMLDGVSPDLTDGATHYHTRAVRPRWSRAFPRTAAIGQHYFYRQPTRISSN